MYSSNTYYIDILPCINTLYICMYIYIYTVYYDYNLHSMCLKSRNCIPSWDNSNGENGVAMVLWAAIELHPVSNLRIYRIQSSSIKDHLEVYLWKFSCCMIYIYMCVFINKNDRRQGLPKRKTNMFKGSTFLWSKIQIPHFQTPPHRGVWRLDALRPKISWQQSFICEKISKRIKSFFECDIFFQDIFHYMSYIMLYHLLEC